MLRKNLFFIIILMFSLAASAENSPVANEKESTLKTAIHETKAAIDQHQALSTEQIDELKKQNQTLKDQLSKMQQQLDQTRSAVIDKNTAIIEQKLAAINKQETAAQKKRYQIDLHLAIALMVLGFLVLTFIFTTNRKIKLEPPKAPQSPISAESANELEEEYDFMNTKEAWPVKLDLARAYMDMHDFENAKILLNEIKNCPDKKLIKEADKLLKKIPLV